MDLMTVTKAAQVISEEIVLDKLMENAGGQRGILLLDKAGKLFVEAEGAIDRDVTVVL